MGQNQEKKKKAVAYGRNSDSAEKSPPSVFQRWEAADEWL